MGLFNSDRKARRKASKDQTFQLVTGGHVRRIEFEDDVDIDLDGPETEAQPVVEEAPEHEPKAKRFFSRITGDASDAGEEDPDGRQTRRVYRPRHVAPLDDIRFEVDHLEMLRAGYVPKNTPRDRTDLRSKAARTLYTTDKGGRVVEAPTPSGRRTLYTSGPDILSERRFHEKLVDEIVKDIDLEEAIVVEDEVTEYVPKSKAEGIQTPKAKAKTVKKAPAKPAAKTPAKKATKSPVKTDKDLQPQCGALTAAGGQCKNSARGGSKYCGSHKGYRPPAKTVASKADDTAPVVSKAKDTKPSARRTQVTKYGYKLFRNGNRFFFSKNAQKDVDGRPVYAMPSDKKVVRTPNGLPVLKNKA